MDRAFGYLADPGNRPAWQSTLRSVADLVVPADAAGELADATAAGVTWTDVTVVPGVRPRMRTTHAEAPQRWVEEGSCGPFRAHLELRFEPDGDGTRVIADFAVRGLGVGRLVTVGSRRTIAADLRRAARLAARER